MEAAKKINTQIVTDRRIQQSYRHEFFNRYDFMAPNIFIDGGHFECDIMGIRPSGFVDEIEMKCTVSDYKADFKKQSSYAGWWDNKKGINCNPRGNKHESIQSGRLICNYFSFLVPIEIVEKIDVPDYCGLYAWHQPSHNRFNLQIETIKKAPKLHNEKRLNDKAKMRILLKLQYRFWDIR